MAAVRGLSILPLFTFSIPSGKATELVKAFFRMMTKWIFHIQSRLSIGNRIIDTTHEKILDMINQD